MTCCAHADTVAHNSYQIGPASKYVLHITSQAVLEKHTHTHTAAQHRGSWVSRSGGLQMFGVPQQLLELQWSVSPGGRRAEAQRHRNRMEHEVTTQSLASPQHLKLLALPTSCEQTSSQHKGGGVARWWLLWISSFLDTGLFLHWYCIFLKRVKVKCWSISTEGKSNRVRAKPSWRIINSK